MSHPKLEEILDRDPRFPFESYEFIFHALGHTQKLLDGLPEGAGDEADEGDEQAHRHISGQELCRGACDLAQREFGLLARAVFQQWNINTTDDIGDIVFNLIEAGLMSKTDQDQRADFHNVFDLGQALTEGYIISGRPQDEDE